MNSRIFLFVAGLFLVTPFCALDALGFSEIPEPELLVTRMPARQITFMDGTNEVVLQSYLGVLGASYATTSNELNTLEASYAIISNEVNALLESFYVATSNELTALGASYAITSNELNTLEASYVATSNAVNERVPYSRGSYRHLAHTGDPVTSGSLFTSTYANVTGPAVISLDPGTWNIGSVFYFTKPDISVVGSGIDRTIFKNRFVILNTATNTTLESFTLENNNPSPSDTFTCGFSASQKSGLRMSDVKVTTTNSGDHIFEVTGKDIKLERVHTFYTANQTNNGHLFSVKGVTDVVISDCSSEGTIGQTRFNGILFKASSDVGSLSNVVVNGFTTRGASAGVYLDANNAGIAFRNLSLRNISVYDTLYGVYFDGDPGFNAAHENIDLQLDVRDVSNPLLTSQATLENVKIKMSGTKVNTTSPPFIFANKTATNDLQLELDVESPIGKQKGFYFVNSGGDSLFSGDIGGFRQTYNVTLPRFSVAAHSNFVPHVASDTTNLVAIVNSNSYFLNASTLVVGDPIWINGGTASGYYRYLSSGDVTTTNNPIAGAGVGNRWYRMSLGGKAPSTSFTSGHLQPGKVGARFNSNPAAYLRGSVKVTGIAEIFAATHEAQTASAISYFNSNADLNTTPVSIYSSSTYVPVYPAVIPHMNSSGVDKPYFALFGGFHLVSSWGGQQYINPSLTIEFSGTELSYGGNAFFERLISLEE